MHVIQSQANLTSKCDSFTALFWGHCGLICLVLTYIINKTGLIVSTYHYIEWIKQDTEQNISSESGLHNIVTAWFLLLLFSEVLIHCKMHCKASMLTMPNRMCWTNCGLFLNLNLLWYSIPRSLSLFQCLFLCLQCSFTSLYYTLLSFN